MRDESEALVLMQASRSYLTIPETTTVSFVAKFMDTISSNLTKSFREEVKGKFNWFQEWHFYVFISIGVSLPILVSSLFCFCICKLCLWQRLIKWIVKFSPRLTQNGFHGISNKEEKFEKSNILFFFKPEMLPF